MAELVRTAEELRDAIESGAEDIQIVSHIDGSALASPAPALTVGKQTRRIRGACSTEVAGALAAKVSAAAPSLQRSPGQCIIYVESSFLHVRADSIWMDSLMFVHGPILNQTSVSHMLAVKTGSLFLTSSQLIGSITPGAEVQALIRAVSVEAEATKAYFRDVAVTNVTASISPVAVAAPATFDGCTLEGRPVPNRAIAETGPERSGTAPAALQVRGTDALLRGTAVAAKSSENEAVLSSAAAPARVFADAPLQVVSGRWAPLAAEPAAAAPLALSQMHEAEEFEALQQGTWGEPAAEALPPATPSPAAVNETVIAIIATLAGLLLAGLAVAIWRWRRRHSAAFLAGDPAELGQASHPDAASSPKHAKSAPSSYGDSRPSTGPSHPGAAPHLMVHHQVRFSDASHLETYPEGLSASFRASGVDDTDAAPPGHRAGPRTSNFAMQQRLEASYGAASGSTPRGSGSPPPHPPPRQQPISVERSGQIAASVQHLLSERHGAPGAAAAPAAAPEGHTVAAVLAELDRLPPDCAAGLHSYVWNGLGPGHRRGGQGVVVFVMKRLRGEEIAEARAMKIFARERAFVEEMCMFSNAALAPFMPRIYECSFRDGLPQAGPERQVVEGISPEVVHQEQQLLTAPATAHTHAVLARPFIVMEKGVSLAECHEQYTRDLITTLAMLLDVTSCLRQLHACGYVHRDVKPDNLLLVQRSGHGEWTFIDCGLSRRAGAEASASFTTHFAAPEVLAAYRAGRPLVVDPAQDAWSLGVTIFNVLAPDAPYFRAGREEIIEGDAQRSLLPSAEAGAAQHGMQDHRLGELLPRLLAADPRQRMSVHDFYDALVERAPGQH